MGLFKDAPPRVHPEYTQMRFMTAGSPSWWKQNRHKVLAVAGLLAGFWLAGHHPAPTPTACTPATTSTVAR
ncbi:hypothetical protein P3T37_002866 [Kitasatospora sp. MAA4]|uniref:hypothetical protein n=1 Tax=Kitasatospora sp. MAA4 TaxID=3035093 RepID=UPI002476880D|nr:hypothetical protein [Kitasatospora sp. MAA4]MDH6133470.1 hypothetical protein [Kitasatospora sp. MAA4]